MNLLEKEALHLEGLEHSTGEVPHHFKVSKTSLIPNKTTAAQVRASKAVAYREPRFLSISESRRYMSERSQKLFEFVAPLEEEIRRTSRLRRSSKRAGRIAVTKVADLVLEVVGKITHRETGLFSLDPNVPLLLSTLYAGSVEASIVSGLVRRAQAALSTASQGEENGFSYGGAVAHAEAGTGESYDVARELNELTMLLKWFVRRKMSLAAVDVARVTVDEHSDFGSGDEFQEEDVLFGFEVLHDHQVFGAKGCFVTCGLRLVGHDGQPLWLRVGVKWNGAAVSVRPEWSSWTDPGGSSPVEILSDSPSFCSLVPIRPNAQRLVIDDIRAFVPYAALDLPSGRCDVELVTSVVDGDGREILSASRAEGICIPRRELVNTNVPAPHSVGMWPHDVVSGDKLSELKVTPGFKIVGGWERHTISVSFDLALFMHAGESVLLECRFLDERGDLVELSSLGIPYVASDMSASTESVSSYRYRRTLHPKSAWSHFRGLCIDIPVEFLLLQGRTHCLTCEVVIVSSDDRVLCGDMGLVTVLVPGLAEDVNDSSKSRVQSGSRDSSEPVLLKGALEGLASGIELESIEIDPTWKFASDECVRVQATFCPKNASKRIAELAAGRVGELFAPYRVEVSVEREDGHVLLQAFSDVLGIGFKPVTRGVCVEGHSGFAEHSVVANFSKDEILGWSFGHDGNRGVSKLRLFARVRALTLDGQLLLSDVKEFYVKPPSGGGKRVVEVGAASPRVVDVVAHTYVQSPRISCRALVNVPHGRFLEEGFMVEASLLRPDGLRESIFRRKVSLAHSAAWVRQQMGLSQVAVEFEHALTSDAKGTDTRLSTPLSIELSVKSIQGDVIQVVHQEVKTAGVLLGAQASMAERLSVEMEHSEHTSARNGIENGAGASNDLLPVTSMSAGQRLFSWLRG